MAAHVKRIAARDYFVVNVADDSGRVFPPYKVTVIYIYENCKNYGMFLKTNFCDWCFHLHFVKMLGKHLFS